MKTKQSILFVDDEPKVLKGLERALRDKKTESSLDKVDKSL